MEPHEFRENVDRQGLPADQDQTHTRRRRRFELSEGRTGYEFRLGRVPVSLSVIEYRVIRFLADRPYKAFTREQIAAEVHTEEHPIDEVSVDAHVQSLRDKLGMFSDYIQSVPYIGYRFKP